MKPPYFLLALDPGGTTGYAMFYVGLDQTFLAYAGEMPLWYGLETLIARPAPLQIVYEKITPRSPAFNPIGLQVIGVIRYLAEPHNIPLDSQPNSVIRGISRWGTYDLSPVASPHARDAVKHGLVYLRRKSIVVPTEGVMLAP